MAGCPALGFSQLTDEPKSEFILSANTTIMDLQQIKAQYLSMDASFHIYQVSYDSAGRLQSLEARIRLANGNIKDYKCVLDETTVLALLPPDDVDDMRISDVPPME